ncbi:TrkH family potassium uptake protein [Acaryochloris sp. 'Moss Beach']|uniref:TrkH family potassium uptake protein n=1 Tax=Acaryochloris sp. 'Moss Beach' TaxID=2740837 RepID=UPI001F4758F2|nr:potassium transporter TrkG [Acaryochloris sp. 'Moss Beach']
MKPDLKMYKYLSQRYRAILGYTGLVCFISGLTLLAPLLALPVYPEEIIWAWGYLLPGLTLALVGAIGWKSLVPKQALSLTLSEGSVIVVLAWIVSILASTFPLMTTAGLTFTQAIFEATSGWTTTGLSVVDVGQASHLTLLFRSVIELVGGAGLAIVTLSALAGPVGASLPAAEGRTEQLAPNVRRSAKLVLSIYSGYIAIGIVALRIAGMGWFDAINHAFAALSTGGFSTQADSIGYWDNPAIEAVTIVLMLGGTINFVTSYLLLTGRFKSVVRNGEIRLQALLIPASTALLFFGVTTRLYPIAGKAFRVALFEMVSALSTTGFSTVGYTDWNSLGWLVMIVLMLIGGGAGSTAGGIKQYRIYVLYRSLLWEVKRMMLPQHAVTEPRSWQGENQHFLSDALIRQVSVLVSLYLLVFGIGSCVTVAYGYSLPDSLFEYASTLSTVGLSVGVTAADAPTGLLWTQTIGMFLGRLEFFTVFVGLIRLYKDVPALLR